MQERNLLAIIDNEEWGEARLTSPTLPFNKFTTDDATLGLYFQLNPNELSKTLYPPSDAFDYARMGNASAQALIAITFLENLAHIKNPTKKEKLEFKVAAKCCYLVLRNKFDTRFNRVVAEYVENYIKNGFYASENLRLIVYKSAKPFGDWCDGVELLTHQDWLLFEGLEHKTAALPLIELLLLRGEFAKIKTFSSTHQRKIIDPNDWFNKHFPNVLMGKEISATDVERLFTDSDFTKSNWYQDILYYAMRDYEPSAYLLAKYYARIAAQEKTSTKIYNAITLKLLILAVEKKFEPAELALLELDEQIFKQQPNDYEKIDWQIVLRQSKHPLVVQSEKTLNQSTTKQSTLQQITAKVQTLHDLLLCPIIQYYTSSKIEAVRKNYAKYSRQVYQNPGYILNALPQNNQLLILELDADIKFINSKIRKFYTNRINSSFITDHTLTTSFKKKLQYLPPGLSNHFLRGMQEFEAKLHVAKAEAKAKLTNFSLDANTIARAGETFLTLDNNFDRLSEIIITLSQNLKDFSSEDYDKIKTEIDIIFDLINTITAYTTDKEITNLTIAREVLEHTNKATAIINKIYSRRNDSISNMFENLISATPKFILAVENKNEQLNNTFYDFEEVDIRSMLFDLGKKTSVKHFEPLKVLLQQLSTKLGVNMDKLNAICYRQNISEFDKLIWPYSKTDEVKDLLKQIEFKWKEICETQLVNILPLVLNNVVNLSKLTKDPTGHYLQKFSNIKKSEHYTIYNFKQNLSRFSKTATNSGELYIFEPEIVNEVTKPSFFKTGPNDATKRELCLEGIRVSKFYVSELEQLAQLREPWNKALADLKEELKKLRAELENYKQYPSFIASIETKIKTILGESAYTNNQYDKKELNDLTSSKQSLQDLNGSSKIDAEFSLFLNDNTTKFTLELDRLRNFLNSCTNQMHNLKPRTARIDGICTDINNRLSILASNYQLTVKLSNPGSVTVTAATTKIDAQAFALVINEFMSYFDDKNQKELEPYTKNLAEAYNNKDQVIKSLKEYRKQLLDFYFLYLSLHKKKGYKKASLKALTFAISIELAISNLLYEETKLVNAELESIKDFHKKVSSFIDSLLEEWPNEITIPNAKIAKKLRIKHDRLCGKIEDLKEKINILTPNSSQVQPPSRLTENKSVLDLWNDVIALRKIKDTLKATFESALNKKIHQENIKIENASKIAEQAGATKQELDNIKDKLRKSMYITLHPLNRFFSLQDKLANPLISITDFRSYLDKMLSRYQKSHDDYNDLTKKYVQQKLVDIKQKINSKLHNHNYKEVYQKYTSLKVIDKECDEGRTKLGLFFDAGFNAITEAGAVNIVEKKIPGINTEEDLINLLTDIHVKSIQIIEANSYQTALDLLQDKVQDLANQIDAYRLLMAQCSPKSDQKIIDFQNEFTSIMDVRDGLETQAPAASDEPLQFSLATVKARCKTAVDVELLTDDIVDETDALQTLLGEIKTYIKNTIDQALITLELSMHDLNSFPAKFQNVSKNSAVQAFLQKIITCQGLPQTNIVEINTKITVADDLFVQRNQLKQRLDADQVDFDNAMEELQQSVIYLNMNIDAYRKILHDCLVKTDPEVIEFCQQCDTPLQQQREIIEDIIAPSPTVPLQFSATKVMQAYKTASELNILNQQVKDMADTVRKTSGKIKEYESKATNGIKDELLNELFQLSKLLTELRAVPDNYECSSEVKAYCEEISKCQLLPETNLDQVRFKHARAQFLNFDKTTICQQIAVENEYYEWITKVNLAMVDLAKIYEEFNNAKQYESLSLTLEQRQEYCQCLKWIADLKPYLDETLKFITDAGLEKIRKLKIHERIHLITQIKDLKTKLPVVTTAFQDLFREKMRAHVEPLIGAYQSEPLMRNRMLKAYYKANNNHGILIKKLFDCADILKLDSATMQTLNDANDYTLNWGSTISPYKENDMETLFVLYDDKQIENILLKCLEATNFTKNIFFSALEDFIFKPGLRHTALNEEELLLPEVIQARKNLKLIGDDPKKFLDPEIAERELHALIETATTEELKHYLRTTVESVKLAFAAIDSHKKAIIDARRNLKFRLDAVQAELLQEIQKFSNRTEHIESVQVIRAKVVGPDQIKKPADLDNIVQQFVEAVRKEVIDTIKSEIISATKRDLEDKLKAKKVELQRKLADKLGKLETETQQMEDTNKELSESEKLYKEVDQTIQNLYKENCAKIEKYYANYLETEIDPGLPCDIVIEAFTDKCEKTFKKIDVMSSETSKKVVATLDAVASQLPKERKPAIEKAKAKLEKAQNLREIEIYKTQALSTFGSVKQAHIKEQLAGIKNEVEDFKKYVPDIDPGAQNASTQLTPTKFNQEYQEILTAKELISQLPAEERPQALRKIEEDLDQLIEKMHKATEVAKTRIEEKYTQLEQLANAFPAALDNLNQAISKADKMQLQVENPVNLTECKQLEITLANIAVIKTDEKALDDLIQKTAEKKSALEKQKPLIEQHLTQHLDHQLHKDLQPFLENFNAEDLDQETTAKVSQILIDLNLPADTKLDSNLIKNTLIKSKPEALQKNLQQVSATIKIANAAATQLRETRILDARNIEAEQLFARYKHACNRFQLLLAELSHSNLKTNKTLLKKYKNLTIANVNAASNALLIDDNNYGEWESKAKKSHQDYEFYAVDMENKLKLQLTNYMTQQLQLLNETIAKHQALLQEAEPTTFPELQALHQAVKPNKQFVLTAAFNVTEIVPTIMQQENLVAYQTLVDQIPELIAKATNEINQHQQALDDAKKSLTQELLKKRQQFALKINTQLGNEAKTYLAQLSKIDLPDLKTKNCESTQVRAENLKEYENKVQPLFLEVEAHIDRYKTASREMFAEHENLLTEFKRDKAELNQRRVAFDQAKNLPELKNLMQKESTDYGALVTEKQRIDLQAAKQAHEKKLQQLAIANTNAAAFVSNDKMKLLTKEYEQIQKKFNKILTLSDADALAQVTELNTQTSKKIESLIADTAARKELRNKHQADKANNEKRLIGFFEKGHAPQSTKPTLKVANQVYEPYEILIRPLLNELKKINAPESFWFERLKSDIKKVDPETIVPNDGRPLKTIKEHQIIDAHVRTQMTVIDTSLVPLSTWQVFSGTIRLTLKSLFLPLNDADEELQTKISLNSSIKQLKKHTLTINNDLAQAKLASKQVEDKYRRERLSDQSRKKAIDAQQFKEIDPIVIPTIKATNDPAKEDPDKEDPNKKPKSFEDLLAELQAYLKKSSARQGLEHINSRLEKLANDTIKNYEELSRDLCTVIGTFNPVERERILSNRVRMRTQLTQLKNLINEDIQTVKVSLDGKKYTDNFISLAGAIIQLEEKYKLILSNHALIRAGELGPLLSPEHLDQPENKTKPRFK